MYILRRKEILVRQESNLLNTIHNRIMFKSLKYKTSHFFSFIFLYEPKCRGKSNGGYPREGDTVGEGG